MVPFTEPSRNGPTALPSFTSQRDGEVRYRAWFRDGIEAGGAADELVVEEELIVDDRSGVSPAQEVENRLTHRLNEASMPVSHLQMRGILRGR